MPRGAVDARLRAEAELLLRARRRERTAEIRPHAGPQTLFYETTADIAGFGGAAGGGKTVALLLETARHRDNPRFAAVVFRRTLPEVTNSGGLWDESGKLFPLLDPRVRSRTLPLGWRFPSGAVVRFSHLQHEHDVHAWQGAQVPLICFDEAVHFTEHQFFYMLSRNRSTCGVRPRVRLTMNPDADSWVAAFFSWWIGEDGYPIPERIGVHRYMGRDGDDLLWGDSLLEVYEKARHVFDGPLAAGATLDDLIKSVTFIPAKLSDNPTLMRENPSYLGNLLALPLVERERLLGGNWKIRRIAGLVFQRGWFSIVRAAPARARRVRFWDLAATVARGGSDPDWTVGVKLAELDGLYWVEDVQRIRARPHDVELLVAQTAALDGLDVDIGIEQEPGSSGVNTIDHYTRRVLSGYTVRGIRSSGSKERRADPVSAAAEARNVELVAGPWNGPYLDEHEVFPQGAHDDQVDATSGAFRMLHDGRDVVLV